MTSDQRARWQGLFEQKILASDLGDDPAHDLAHFKRVAATALQLCEEERARFEIVLPAAWLHDLVNVPKNDPRRSQASRFSAEAALEYLRSIAYPEAHLSDVAHAIEAHSFSAGIEPRTLEAAIVQDADRLDGLGAIGIARCFSVGGLLRRKIYHPGDPLAQTRKPDDLEYTIDHFFVKLFKTADTLRTRAGRAEGARRVAYMRGFLDELMREI